MVTTRKCGRKPPQAPLDLVRRPQSCTMVFPGALSRKGQTMSHTQAPSSPAVADRGPTAQAAPSAESPSPRRWRWEVAVALVVAGLGGGAWFYLAHRPRDESRIVLQGNIDVRQVNLAFKVEGRIEALAVDEGDAVISGQVIATLDKRYFHDDLRAARARRDNA